MTSPLAELEAGRPINLKQALAAYTGELVLAALDAADGSTRAAAGLLGMPESTLRYRVRVLARDR